MASDAALNLLSRRYQDILIRLSASTADQVARLWDRFGSLDAGDQARFARAAAAIIEAAQRQAAMLADAYMRNYIGQLTGTVPVSVLDVASMVELRGVATVDVYARPTVTARTAISQGRTYAEALRAARDRAMSAADTDVKMAARQASRDAMVSNGFEHYRRVPDANACTFCLTASTQRYNSADLMPLHARCGCTVAPLAAGAPLVVDKALVARLKAASDRPDYWNDPKAAVAVREHGELGPVLVARNQKFSGPGDIAA